MGWIETIKDNVSNAYNWAKEAIVKVYNSVKNLVSNVVSSGTEAVDQVKDFVSDKAKEVYYETQKAYQKAEKKAQQEAERVLKVGRDWVSSAVSSANEYLKSLPSSLIDGAKEMMSDITAFIEATAGAGIAKAKEAMNKVYDFIRGGLDVGYKSALDSTGKIIEDSKEVKPEETKKIEEEIKAEEDKKKEEIGWWFDFMKAIGSPTTLNLQKFIEIYRLVTDKYFNFAEWKKTESFIDEWIVPLNALSKLYTNENLKGEKESFGSLKDYTDLALGVAMFIPVGKVGGVTEKVIAKGGMKGAESFFIQVGDKLVSEKTYNAMIGHVIKKPGGLAWLKSFIKKLPASAKASPLLALVFLTQFDVLLWSQNVISSLTGDERKRFERLSYDVTKNNNKAYNLITIKPTEETKEQALIILRANKPLLEQMIKLIYRRDIFKVVADRFPDYEIQLKSYVAEYNRLVGKVGGSSLDLINMAGIELEAQPELIITPELIEENLGKEFNVSNFIIDDGDTITWKENPLKGYLMKFKDPDIASIDVIDKIRFLGFDAHESATTAGAKETEYLRSLIQGKTINVKIHQYFTPDMVIGRYGRVLGGVFADGKDVALEMLKKFGSDLLPPTSYQDKYRWIDWDLYKAEAKKSLVGKGKITIMSSPANCEIYLDGNNTLKLANEVFILDEGSYTFKLSKEGYQTEEKTISISEGDVIEEKFTLKKQTSSEEETEKLIKTTTIGVSSSPTHADIILDGVNTNLKTSEILKNITPGTHIVKIDLFGYNDYEETVNVALGEKVEVYSKLTMSGEPIDEEGIKIQISSNPQGAKIWIDENYTHHVTPTTQVGLSDVLYLLTPGTHVIKVTKGGQLDEITIDVVAGGEYMLDLTLQDPTLPTDEEEVLAVAPFEIPEIYTKEQEFILTDLFTKIYNYVGWGVDLSADELKILIDSTVFYSDDEKIVSDLLLRDVYVLTKGALQMSKDEYQQLEIKYRMD